MWLRNAAIGIFIAAILGGIFLPVYTDEIGWRLQERAGFDGVDKLFSQLCGPNTLAQPPFWMMPARYYSALFNTLFPEPIYVRLSGILYALVWTGMLLALIRRVADGARAIMLSILALGLLSLGTMPLLLVWSRPEQPILLAFTGAMLIATTDWKRGGTESSARTAWLRAAAILLLALIALSYHVKAIAAIPLFLACLAFATRGARTLVPRLVIGAVLVGAAVWAGHYWIDRFACPTDPGVRAVYERNTGAALVSATSVSQLWPVIDKALGNLSLYIYPGLPAPRVEPMSDWLPSGKISAGNSFAWFLAMVFVWTLALIGSAMCLLRAACRGWRERRLDSRAVLALVLFMTVVGWSAAGFSGVYEASFAVPIMMFAVVLALSTDDDARYSGGVRILAVGAGLAGIASIAMVAVIYGPSLARATGERGYVKGQPYSISAFGYGGVESEIMAAARLCGIAEPVGKRRLLIDDVTYFPFMQSYMPEHRFGLFVPMVTTHDKIGYLRGIGSDGIIVSCSGLPPDVRARSRRQGQFCCIAPLGK